MGHRLYTQQERTENIRYRHQQKAQIESGITTNLQQIDWERITDRYEEKSFEEFVRSFSNLKLQKAIIKICLTQFEQFIIRTSWQDYQEYGIEEFPFYKYAHTLEAELESAQEYDISSLLAGNKSSQIVLPEELDNDDAKEYLQRLVGKYCHPNLDWIDNTQKTYIAEVAHILSGLLDLQNKWSPFQKLWNVSNLAQAYSKKNGTPPSYEINSIYPEYKDN